MTVTQTSALLSADKPLSDPKNDRLGYAPFAKQLAESIYTMIPPEGLVMAIYGPWGSGKSTVLEFVEFYLKEKPEKEQPNVVRFNPWWFSGYEDLAKRFFDQLLIALSRSRREHLAEHIPGLIKTLGSLVSGAPVVGTGIEKATESIPDPSERDVTKIKEKISDALRKQEQRILIMIDDIDRLTAEEIRQLFRVIKAVADFPNVVYLLAFDKEVVIKALGEAQGIPGEEYLEKIVQVPFELPIPDKISLARILDEKLEFIFADTLRELINEDYLRDIYRNGIEHLISTPRDVTRIINALGVTYPAVKNEVNAVDYFAVEALRILQPYVYDIIRRNREMFVGAISDPLYGTSDRETFKNFHKIWMSDLDDSNSQAITNILKKLFPKFENIGRNVIHGSDWLSGWRRARRVCSPDIFPIFFSWNIPESTMPYAEIRANLSLTSDSKAFRTKLLELAQQKRSDGITRARVFLGQLEDYVIEDIPIENIPLIVEVLFDIADELIAAEEEIPSHFGNMSIQIGRVTNFLLRRLDQVERFEILKKAFLNGRAAAKIVDEVIVLGQQHGKYEGGNADWEERRIVSLEQLQELEKIALEKVRASVEDGTLLGKQQLRALLYFWREMAGEGEVSEWVQKVTQVDSGLVHFLEKYLTTTFVTSQTGTISYPRLDPEWLESYLEPSQIIDRVRRLATDETLTENQRLAMKQFVTEYEIRQEGKDPKEELDPFNL